MKPETIGFFTHPESERQVEEEEQELTMFLSTVRFLPIVDVCSSSFLLASNMFGGLVSTALCSEMS